MTEPTPTPQFRGVGEVAAMLGVSEMTITRQIHRGKLPAVRVGHLLRISQSDLDKYLRDNAVGRGPDTRNVTNRDHR